MTESVSENRSIYRLRWLGYGLLLFALMDAIQILIPLGFTNPAWELQTIGALVERVPVPLLGLGLVFFGEFYDRTRLEKLPLKVLSWLCLIVAVLFVLMVPLGVLSTVRLNTQTGEQVNNQVQQQLSQLKQLEDQLNQSKPEELQTLASRLSNFGISVNTQNPEGLKTEILSRINRVRSQVQEQSQVGRAGQRAALLKNAIKWNLGALIAATLFFILWKTTDWAR